MNRIVKQYQTHEVFRNNNSLTEMNHLFRKLETPCNQATQPNNTEQTITQEQRVNQEKLKRILNGEKTTLPSLRNRMRNRQEGNGKGKSSTNLYINN